MKGFRDFVMRGNLVELAVAFVMGAAFATVVATFTAMLMNILGRIGGNPNFNAFKPGGVPVGAFLTALVSFLILAAVVYFFVVKPYEAARTRFVEAGGGRRSPGGRPAAQGDPRPAGRSAHRHHVGTA